IHRLRADPGNRDPVRMLGIEPRHDPSGPPRRALPLPGLAVEYHDQQATTYRIRLAEDQRTTRLRPAGPALLVLVAGEGVLGAEAGTDGRHLRAGSVRWLGDDPDLVLHNPARAPLDAMLVVVHG